MPADNQKARLTEIDSGTETSTPPELIAEQGNAEELLALLDRVEGLASQVGGVERFRACLVALKKLAA